MAITDLTGTKWVFNDGINVNSGFTTDTSYTSEFFPYSINFVDANNNSYINLGCGSANERIWDVFIYGSGLSTPVYMRGWFDIAYKTISITGGTDATNANLISWLQANATQIIEPTSNTYTITHTLTNVNKGNITLQLTPDTGYELPDTISVSNGTLVSYDKTTGIAVISGDDNTSVSVECVASSAERR